MTDNGWDSNPYLTLGIDYGASPSEASQAFALRVRDARRGRGPHSMADLTEALHAIEHSVTPAMERIDLYRVPIRAAAYWPLPSKVPVPPARPMSRRSVAGAGRASATAQVLADLAAAALEPWMTAPPDPYGRCGQ